MEAYNFFLLNFFISGGVIETLVGVSDLPCVVQSDYMCGLSKQ